LPELHYIFINQIKELKPIYRTAYEFLKWKGNRFDLYYEDEHLSTNDCFSVLDRIEIKKDWTARIIGKYGLILEVRDFWFGTTRDTKYRYTVFNLFSKKFDEDEISSNNITAIIFSPYPD